MKPAVLFGQYNCKIESFFFSFFPSVFSRLTKDFRFWGKRGFQSNSIRFKSEFRTIQNDPGREREREREREKERKKRPKSTPGNDGVVPFRETTGAEENSRRVCGGVVAPGPYFFTPAVSASFSGSVQIL